MEPVVSLFPIASLVCESMKAHLYHHLHYYFFFQTGIPSRILLIISNVQRKTVCIHDIQLICGPSN